VIVDEAHHAVADSYRTLLAALGCFETDGPRVLGVSATMYRADGKGLGDVFESLAFDAPLLDMVRAGYLANVRAKQIELAVDLDALRIVDGDYHAGDLADALIALVRAVHSQDREAPDATRAASGTVLLEQVKAYVEAHLGDPDLGPEALARAHYVSTRYLQKLFAREGVTVTEWVRRRRLEACRRDLCDPALLHEPISQIARRWALANPAHFSRLFRETYGCTPSGLRSRARSA